MKADTKSIKKIIIFRYFLLLSQILTEKNSFHFDDIFRIIIYLVRIYLLKESQNLRSISLFHAMARLGYTGLIITRPRETFVSIGMLDNLEKVIDYQACQSLNIPIIRRETGGGAVLLSSEQVFYQVILPKSLVPFKVIDAYVKLSEPVIRTYSKLGLEAKYKPVNDIVVNGKKISGQASADIEKCFVFVGNILIDFDTALMSKVFKLPDETLRSAIKEALDENITWLKRHINRPITFEEISNTLIDEFSKDLPFEGFSEVPKEALDLADKLKQEFTSEECLFEDTGRKHEVIKIREGVFVKNVSCGNKKGSLLIENGVIRKVWGPFEHLIGSEYRGERLLGSFSPELVDCSTE